MDNPNTNRSLDEIMSTTTVQGKLEEVFPLLKPETIQHAREIEGDLLLNEMNGGNFWDIIPRGGNGIYTADSILYTVEEENPIVYIGPRETNLIFRDVEKATDQLKKDDYYPTTDQINSVRNHKGVLRINMGELDLKRWSKCSYFDTIDNNQSRQSVVEQLYGITVDKEGFKHRIFFLDPNIVFEKVPEGRGISRLARTNRGYNLASKNLRPAGLRGQLIIDYQGLAAQLGNPSVSPSLLGRVLNKKQAYNLQQALRVFYANQAKG